MRSNSDSFVFDEIPTQEQLLATMVSKARKRKVETGVAEYGLTVRRSVRGLWKGYFSVNQFINMMSGAIRIGFTHAWHDGIATCGFKPSIPPMSTAGRKAKAGPSRSSAAGSHRGEAGVKKR